MAEKIETGAGSIEIQQNTFQWKDLERGGTVEKRTIYDPKLAKTEAVSSLVHAQSVAVALIDKNSRSIRVALREKKDNAYTNTFLDESGKPIEAKASELFVVLAETEVTAEQASQGASMEMGALFEDISKEVQSQETDWSKKLSSIVNKLGNWLKGLLGPLQSMFGGFFGSSTEQQSADTTSKDDELKVLQAYLKEYKTGTGVKEGADQTTVAEGLGDLAAISIPSLTAQEQHKIRQEGLEKGFTVPAPLKREAVLKLPLPTRERLAEVRRLLTATLFTDKQGKTLPVETTMRLLQKEEKLQKLYAEWLRWRLSETKSDGKNTRQEWQKNKTFADLMPSTDEVAATQEQVKNVSSTVKVASLRDSKYATYQKLRFAPFDEPASSRIQGLMAHITAGNSLGDAMRLWSSNNNVVQYIIDTDGTIVQLMPDNSVIAGAESSTSLPSLMNAGQMIHVECVATGVGKLNQKQTNALHALVKAKMQQHDFPMTNVIGHGMLQDKHDSQKHERGQDFNYQQVQNVIYTPLKTSNG